MDRAEYMAMAAERAAKSQRVSRRVYSLLRSSIRDGSVGLGDRLAEEVLTSSLETSRNAVREALVQLASDGLVDRSPRYGTVVVGSIRPMAMGTSFRRPDLADEVRTTVLERRSVTSTSLIEHRLQLDSPTYDMIECLIEINGQPFGLHTSYVAPGQESVLSAGVLGLLPDPPAKPEVGEQALSSLPQSFERLHGVALGRQETFVEAVSCDRRTSSKLGTREDAPVLLRERLLIDVHGIARELSYTVFRADRAVFSHVIDYTEAADG